VTRNTCSQIDFLDAVVSDDLMDNDPAFDNFIRNMDLNVQFAQTTSASNALSTHGVFCMFIVFPCRSTCGVYKDTVETF
jgi:hypothetical protein